MGIASSISGRIKGWFGADKQSSISNLKKGDDSRDVAGGAGGGLTSGWNGYDQLSDSLRMEESLLYRYADYEEMDDYPEIGSALDVYADDATVEDAQHNTCIWPLSSDSLVREVLADLLYRRLRIDEDIYALTRGLAKYGNAYAEILVDKNGVVGLNYLPAPSMRRLEDNKGNLIGFIQSANSLSLQSNSSQLIAQAKSGDLPDGVVFFEPYEMIHWRLQGKRVSTTYGYSVLDSARWVFRRLVMAEDSALVYKLTRAPARYAFYIETGNLPPQQRTAYVNQVKQGYKKKKFFNPSTGKLDFRVNPLGLDDDFFIPVANGQESTRIDVLNGPDYQTVEDLEYFRGKLFSALKVPRRYLGFDGGESRASLAQEDVRFARTVMNLQREVRLGYKMACRVHLAALNIDPDQIDFDLRMTTSSSIFELSQLELMNARSDAARNLQEYFPKEWILENVFDMPKDDAIYVQKTKKDEQRDTAIFDAETEAKSIEMVQGAAGGEAGVSISARTPSVSESAGVRSLERRLDRLTEDLKKMRLDSDRRMGVLLDEMVPNMKDVRRMLRRDIANRGLSGSSRPESGKWSA